MEERKKNPMKELAMQLAHSMDDQKRIWNDNLPEWKREEIRETHTYICNEICKKGYNVEMMLRLAEQYKTLKMTEYVEWVNS
jgi:hypothetical protein